MDHLLRDLRHGTRTLRKTPGATLVAVLALSFGIGLTTLMFSIIYGALLRGLPFADQGELVMIQRAKPSTGFSRMSLSIHDFTDWRAEQRSFEDLAGFYQSDFAIANDGSSAEQLAGAYMSASAFDLLGVTSAAGRVFTADDERIGGPAVIVIGWPIWQQRFGGDPATIGRTVRINGEPATIIGVMPPKFGFPSDQDAWMPMRLDPVQTPRGQGVGFRAIGRLRDGVSIQQARTDLERIAARLAAEYPATNEGVIARVTDFTEDTIGREERSVLWTMMGAVIFVLLIACANVTNLLIGRATLRTKEVGVRTALGASRWRVASPFLAESFVLAATGAVIGLAIAWFGIRAFNNAIVDSRPPFWLDIGMHGPVLFIAFAATLLASLAAGAIPAIQAARANTHEILKDESRGASSFKLGRLSRILVAAEMAMSVGLLVGAGLMIKSVVKVHNVDLGFDATRIFTARLNLPAATYPGETERARLEETLTPRLAGLPGVDAVAFASSMPGMGSGLTSFDIEGTTHLSDTDYPTASTVLVSPGFFSTLDVTIAAGREFTEQDRTGAPGVALVNRAFVRKHFQDGVAIGRRLRMGGANSTADWLTIVGVVPDQYASGLEDRFPETIYRSTRQTPLGRPLVLLRSRNDPVLLAGDVRRAVEAIDADVPMSNAGSVAHLLERDNWYYDVFGTLFVAFGAAALFLASIGLYGVMAFSVSTRKREMGVRMAVGADGARVTRMILRQGMTQTAIGLGVGTLFALGVSRLVAAILFQVDPRDPAIFSGILAVLLITAVLACWIPARRAASVDPLEAMRSE